MKEKEFNELVESNDLVLVDFYATWCMPCKMLSAEIEAVEDQLKERLKVVSIDVDSSQELASKFEVSAVPTMAIYKNGLECEQIVGYRSSEDLLDALKKYI